MNFHSISLYRDYSNHLPLSNVSEVFFSQIPKNHIQVQERGVARIFQGGGEGGGGGLLTLCQTLVTYQIGMSTSRQCFTKCDIFFSDEQ